MSIDSSTSGVCTSRIFQTGASSHGYITSKEMLINYIRNMSNSDLKKLLTPVRDGILTENTVLHMNTMYVISGSYSSQSKEQYKSYFRNFSVDHVVVPMTIKDMLAELDPMWKKWIHSGLLLLHLLQ